MKGCGVNEKHLVYRDIQFCSNDARIHLFLWNVIREIHFCDEPNLPLLEMLQFIRRKPLFESWNYEHLPTLKTQWFGVGEEKYIYWKCLRGNLLIVSHSNRLSIINISNINIPHKLIVFSLWSNKLFSIERPSVYKKKTKQKVFQREDTYIATQSSKQ